jgi:hypothetical protein
MVLDYPPMDGEIFYLETRIIGHHIFENTQNMSAAKTLSFKKMTGTASGVYDLAGQSHIGCAKTQE